MKELTIVVYTMKGCPFCEKFKELLVKENIDFVDRDIHENSEEYDLFSKATNNDLIPALLVLESVEGKVNSFLYAPERDYKELNEALDVVKRHSENFGLI